MTPDKPDDFSTLLKDDGGGAKYSSGLGLGAVIGKDGRGFFEAADEREPEDADDLLLLLANDDIDGGGWEALA